MSLRVLIADDELLARKRLLRLLGALQGVECVGECEDGEQVLQRVKQGGVDLLLLDIHMPHLTGMDALELLPRPLPLVVFCTAYSEPAVKAFEVGAVDYLLKPVEAGRLQQAVERARERFAALTAQAAPTAPAPAPGRLAVPTRQGIVLVDPAQVTHAVLEDELVTLHTTSGGPLLTDFTLKELEERLPPGLLMRVHRRALVNLAHLVRLDPLETGGFMARTSRGESVEVSRQTARELRRLLGLRKGADD